VVAERLVSGALLVLAAFPAAAQSRVWDHQIGTAEDEWVRAATPGREGAVFLGGATAGSLGGPGAGWDAWIASLDGAGRRLWLRQLGSSGVEWLFALAQDGRGGVFACGETSGSFGGPISGYRDAWVARLDEGGRLAWIRQLGTHDWTHAFAAAPDDCGGVFVGGSTDGIGVGPVSGLDDAWLARYDGQGNPLWIRQLGTRKGDSLQAAAADGRGGVYVGGRTGGSLGGPSAGGDDAWVARFDARGQWIWTRQLGSPTEEDVRAVAADGTGGVYVGGMTNGNLGGFYAVGTDAWVARFDEAGSPLWLHQLGFGNSLETVWALAADSDGGVYVVGSTFGDLSAPYGHLFQPWIARFEAAGHLLWLRFPGTTEDDQAHAAAPDGSGGVILGGATKGSFAGPLVGGFDAWAARLDTSCSSGETYCVASGTSIPGCRASISGVGSPSLGDPSGFSIASGPVPGATTGLCLFGDQGAASVPLGTLGGMLCVQPPQRLTRLRPSGGTPGACDGELSFTLQELADAAPIVVPGAVLHAQIWARDAASPDGFLLSDGLEFTVCP
jgi:hypothetical protein